MSIQNRRLCRHAPGSLIVLALIVSPTVQAQLLFGRIVPAAPEVQANEFSEAVDMSADGKTLVFTSGATNWVPGVIDTNNKAIAVDLDSETIEIVSRTEAGVIVRGEHPAVSRDGRYVAFATRNATIGGVATSNWQIARKDRLTGQLVLASTNAAGVQGEAHVSEDAVGISGDGNFIAFTASSPNFGVVTGGWEHVFVKNMTTGALIHASVTQAGTPVQNGCRLFPNGLSEDGRYVAMTCDHEIIAGAGRGQLYVRDLVAGSSELISRGSGAGAPATSFSGYPALSPSGRFVTFSLAAFAGIGGSTATHSGVYVRDRATQIVTSIPTPPGADVGRCDNSDVSNVGTVAMQCRTGQIAHTYLYVPGTPVTWLMLSSDVQDVPGNAGSGASIAMDASGLSMAFESLASNLVASDTNNRSDIFLLVDSRVLFGLFSDGFED